MRPEVKRRNDDACRPMDSQEQSKLREGRRQSESDGFGCYLGKRSPRVRSFHMER